MIVFQDVDGCLNAPDGIRLNFSTAILTDQQKLWLRQLGVLLDNSAVTSFVINTGRSWLATKFICEAINSSKIEYVLAEHGCELWDVKNNIALDLVKISDDLGLHKIRDAHESVLLVRDLMSWFYTTGIQQVTADIGYSGQIHCLREKTSNLTIQVPQEVDSDKLLSSLKASIANEERFKNGKFVYHNHAHGYIDVLGQVDKGMGVEIVTKLLGRRPAETFAIGDGLNDLPMLHAVNYPICPANAELEVQDLCSTKGHLSDASYIGAVITWLSNIDN